jgi:hypothetical protein
MNENILDLAIMLRGSSERFLSSLVDETSSAEDLAMRWNDLDTIMLELRRNVADAME